MNRKIFKTGHSLAITVSKKQLSELGLGVGDGVSVEANAEKLCLIIRPAGLQHQLDLGLKLRPRLGKRPA
jgi:antitoxin component of MazEF toxin-antitoxin module